nr:hypothetical protein [Tanacetum cinerariifolium]
MDSILEDSVDEDNLAEPNDNLVDTILEMLTDEHALDYSSPPLYDDYDDDLDEFESSDFLPSPEYDSFLFEDFFEVDALPSTNNEEKVFNMGILIQENIFKVTTRVAPDKNVKKIAISHASLILEDFDPPLYELLFHKENSPNDSSISANSSHNPPHIDERCFECGDALDGIFCQRCACRSCGKDYTIASTPVLSTEEPDNSLSMGDEHLDTILATESDEVIKSSVEDLVLIQSESKGIPDTMCDVHLVNNPTPLEAKDHFEIVINFKDDYSSSDDDSLYYENIEYVEASPHNSELVSLEVEKIVIPEDEKIEDDNLREKLLKVNLLIAKIEALKDNPTPSSEFLTNGSTTTHSDISLSEYEAFSFYDDHIEEISSGGTTTQYDISLPEYDSFIFDFPNDQFSPTDRSDFTHEEFGDEPAHIISPPEYDYFYFRDLLDSGELISSLNSRIRENLSSTTCVNLPVEDDYSPLLAYVV